MIYKKDREKAIQIVKRVISILIAISVSVRLGIVGIEGYIRDI